AARRCLPEGDLHWALRGGVGLGRDGSRGLAMTGQRVRVLLGPADGVLRGEVLARLAHRVDAVELLHPRVDEAPAESGVVSGDGTRLVGPLGLRQDQWGAAHRLDACTDAGVHLAEFHGPGSLSNGLETRRAQAVDGHAGHRHREARQQSAHTGYVAVVLTSLVGAAHDHVSDVALWQPDPA